MTETKSLPGGTRQAPWCRLASGGISEDAGHCLFVDDADRFNTLLRVFYRKPRWVPRSRAISAGTPAAGGRSMKTMEPGEMAKRVGEGLLSFPVTHLRRAWSSNPSRTRSTSPAALPQACRCSLLAVQVEFFLRSPRRVRAVVHAGVTQAARQGACHRRLGYGTAMARSSPPPRNRPGQTEFCFYPLT